MGREFFVGVATALFGLSLVAASQAAPSQSAGNTIEFTDNYGALFYYKASKEPFDIAAAAAKSRSVQFASPIDRAKLQAAEEERIRKGLETVSTEQSLTVNVSVFISPYDPEKKEFSIDLFEQGHYIPVEAYGKDFQLIFENAESYRALKAQEADTRKINNTLYASSAKAVVDFRLTGAGDPTGIAGSVNTIRGIVTRVRLFNGGKQLVPDIVHDIGIPTAVAAQDKAPNEWMIQGLHLGMSEPEFEAAAKSAYGNSTNYQFGREDQFQREDQCGGPNPLAVVAGIAVTPGAVCITFTADKAGIIKQFSVRQVVGYSKDAYDALRKLLIDKFGAVKYKDEAGLGWGQLVGKQAAHNYTVWGGLYGARTRYEHDGGGQPAMMITITDPDFARSQLPAAPVPVTGPKL